MKSEQHRRLRFSINQLNAEKASHTVPTSMSIGRLASASLLDGGMLNLAMSRAELVKVPDVNAT